MDSIDHLIALINQENTLTPALRREHVNFFNIVPDPAPGYNTQVTMRAKPGAPFAGEVPIRYNRFNLANYSNVILSSPDTTYTVASVVEQFNAVTRGYLSVSDIVLTLAPSPPNPEYNAIVLTATDDSLGWFGQVTLALVLGVPDGLIQIVNGLNEYVHETLPLLIIDFPDGMLDYVDNVYGFFNTTMASLFPPLPEAPRYGIAQVLTGPIPTREAGQVYTDLVHETIQRGLLATFQSK